jgi:purine-cytosine permease-like protein
MYKVHTLHNETTLGEKISVWIGTLLFGLMLTGLAFFGHSLISQVAQI